MPLRLSMVQRALLYNTFQTSEQLPDSGSAPATEHKQQGRRTEVFRQATNRKPAFECTRGRERSFYHTACNKHDWSCTVRWHVFQLCVRTLQMTVATTHLGIVIEQTSGDPCPMARVPSKQATHALEQKLETSKWKTNDKIPKP